VDGIIPGSFFSHKCLLSKKKNRFIEDLSRVASILTHGGFLRLSTQSFATLTNGGIVLVNPVSIYILFSAMVTTHAAAVHGFVLQF
jgi:hypothetical protein